MPNEDGIYVSKIFFNEADTSNMPTAPILEISSCNISIQ